MLKRYALFSGKKYHAIGGWQDFQRSYSLKWKAIEIARKYKKLIGSPYLDIWVQVVDLKSGEILYKEGEAHGGMG